MKKTSIGAIIQAIATLYLTYIVWFFLSLVAILLIGTNLFFRIDMSVDSLPSNKDELIVIISQLGGISSNVFPFAELFETMFDGIFDGTRGILLTIVDFFTDSDRPPISISWKYYCSQLMRDLALLSIARLVMYLYNRFKDLFQSIESYFFRFMLVYTTILWVCASFFTADYLVLRLEMVIHPAWQGKLYVVLFFVASGILGVCMAYKSKKRVILKLLIVFLGFGFDVVRSLFVWLWMGSMCIAVQDVRIWPVIEYSLITFEAILVCFGLDKLEKKVLKEHDLTYATD